MHCGKQKDLPTYAYNKAMKRGGNIYCDRKCFSESQKKHHTPEEKKAVHRKWEREYFKREDVKAARRLRHAAWRGTDKGKAAIAESQFKDRSQNRAKYNARSKEFNSRPEILERRKIRYYKENYGDFWEAAYINSTLKKEVNK
jgi:hypothetical protein